MTTSLAPDIDDTGDNDTILDSTGGPHTLLSIEFPEEDVGGSQKLREFVRSELSKTSTNFNELLNRISRKTDLMPAGIQW